MDFTVSMLILILFTSLDEQTTSMTHEFPSYETYQRLRIEYSDTLYCPCSTIKQTYSTFLTLAPAFHPVCSSAFVQDIWLRQLVLNKFTDGTGLYSMDWRSVSLGLFTSLAALCDLAAATVNDALLRFSARTFVSARLLEQKLLNTEINDTMSAFIHNVENEFGRIVKIFRLLQQVDQYFSTAMSNAVVEVTNRTKNGRVEVRIHKFSLYHSPDWCCAERIRGRKHPSYQLSASSLKTTCFDKIFV